MIEVSKEGFFRAVGGPENIHPSSETDRSVWKNQQTGECVGITTPGYAPGSWKERPRYWLDRDFAARKGIEEQQ